MVYLTNGDSNELAFIVYEKRLVFKPSGVMYLGELRRKEATDGMLSLGLKNEDLIFLGYPDAGTFKIFTEHWGIKNPYRSLLAQANKVPYSNSFSAGAPYSGESILRDVTKILLDFKPTRIFVSHPMDNNADHRAFYLYMKVALWDLGKQIPTPQIYPYLVHEIHWPLPRGFHPELAMTPPKQTKNADIDWFNWDLSPDQVEKKRNLISIYKSQIEYNPKYLYTFARKNEIFGDYPAIVLKDDQQGNIDWQSIEGSQNIHPEVVDEDQNKETAFESLAYARRDGYLYIKITSPSWNDKLLGVNLYLISYRRGLPFSYMPKYRLKIAFFKFVSVFEKDRRVFIKDMDVKRTGKNIVIKFPLASLENPHYILSSARSYLKDTAVDRTAWRVLLLE